MPLRIATYNVHSCIGMDRKLSHERIADVIGQLNVDVVALQELDVGRRRTGVIDQARVIAQQLGMEFHFHPSVRLADEFYGDAVLSRWPMRLVRAASLPGLATMPRLEPRGAIWVAIAANGRELQLINTHLGLLARERAAQAEALLGPSWLSNPGRAGPVVLCGDFNAWPLSRVYRQLAARLRDAQLGLPGHRPQKTWMSRLPISRIDHVFVSQEVDVLKVEVPRNRLTRIASDHLPLVVEIEWSHVS